MAEKPALSEHHQKASEADGSAKVRAGAKPAAADGKPGPRAKAPAPGNGAASQAAAGVAGDILERRGLDEWVREFLFQMPSWLVSMVFHMIVLLVLALCTIGTGNTDDRGPLVVSQDDNKVDEIEELEEEPLDQIDVNTDITTVDMPIEQEMDVPFDDPEAAAMKIDLAEFGTEFAPKNDLLATVGTFTGTGLEGRGSGNREGLVRRYGGNAASENAVAAALKWLAAHQCPDGGWSFDLKKVPKCMGQCRNSGSEDQARNAATGLALLPFLGAGQTHKTGEYKKTVAGGLYFLRNHMKPGPQGAALNEPGGRMYSHGIASIVLCEAYAMTHDKSLFEPAQGAINFICYAQDPVGGGWRYEPRQKGDTSVVGWQIMALKSGHMAYLRVPPITVKKAFDYLDSVQANNGANYGYTGPGNGEATTAIGLLCRMYLGWKKDNPSLQRGVAWLSARGPDKNNMYYDYYATQVMRHWEGDEWKKWNEVMRDHLVNTQVKGESHEHGSWSFNHNWSSRGGRVYDTAMATMILEVYYRHMPIYRTQSVEEEFSE